MTTTTPAQVEPTVWHIVRSSDAYYAETVHGTRENAEIIAAKYRPNPWTERGNAHVVPARREYPAAAQARDSYGASYGDYIQRRTDERVDKGRLTEEAARALTLGDMLRGNDGI